MRNCSSADLEELGDVVVRTPVELRADVSTYVCQPVRGGRPPRALAEHMEKHA